MASFFNAHSNFRNRINMQDSQNSFVSARNLYEDVVRKNQEIMKQILTRINDLYCKQEEFDTSIKLINDKIVKISEANDELSHQFKVTAFQQKRQNQIMINDVSDLKRVLKKRNLTPSYEEYLESDFSKEQKVLISIKSRSGRRARQETNHMIEHLQQQREYETKQILQAKIVEQVKIEAQFGEYFEQESKVQISNLVEGEAIIYKNSDNYEVLIKEKFQAVQHNLQAIINNFREEIKVNNMELTQIVKNLQNQLQTTLEKISVKERQSYDGKQNNYNGLQQQLLSKIKEELYQKISKKYFQESMNNLKQRWQQELDSAYEVMNSKLNQTHSRSIQQKIIELKAQIQLSNNLNSIKLQNISYNSTCRSTQCLSPKKMNSSSEVQDNITNAREEDYSKTHKKSQLSSFTTSYSSLFKAKKIDEDKKNNVSGNEQSVSKWKGKAMESLGLVNKKVRRVKRRE